MKGSFLGFAATLVLATLACGLINQAPNPPLDLNGVGTIVAATFQALTPAEAAASPTVATETPPTAISQTNGISISFDNISFIIPDGLANGGSSEKIPAVSAETGAPWEVGPAYMKITLSSYPLQGTMWQPEIRIYPADEFRQVDSIVGDKLNEIMSLVSNPGGPLPKNLPFLPFINAAQVFYEQMQVIYFNNGSGIRYLTQFDQAPIPINNQEMFYTFQGLSKDGKYFISATLPLNAAFLPADGSQNSPTPADGIPMDWNNYENFPVYLNAVTEKISSTDPNAFSPTLAKLDGLIQSIIINSP